MELGGALFYSCMAGLATIIGVLLIFYGEKWARKYSLSLIAFTAGVMLASAFLYLIPESLKLSSRAIPAVLVGMLIFYLLQHIVMLHPCHDEKCRVHRLGMLSLVGFILHSLLDGAIITLGFEVSSDLGIITALAVLLHRLPDGITIAAILLYSVMKRKKVLLYSLIVAGAAPLGALLAYCFLRGISPGTIGMLLALSAGSFIYIAASDLIPETHKEESKLHPLMLMAGVLLLFLAGRLL